MKSALINGIRVRTPWVSLGSGCLLLGFLACSGGASNNLPPGPTGPPSPPAISVPATGTTGFPVAASVQGASSQLTYAWTLSPTTAFFQGGGLTANGPAVSFTLNGTGTATLTCVATAGNAFSSTPATAMVTINPPSSAAGSFQSAGSLRQGRQGLAAALLVNGNVLVTGGVVNGAAQNSTEIYNPTAQTSSVGPNMSTARANHAIAFLSTSTFLITGGGAAPVGTPPSNPNAEIYNSSLNSFSALTSLMATNRAFQTATAIVTPPGVLIAGGLSTAGVQVNSEELFSNGTQTFASAGSVILGPYHTATSLPDGRILLVSHTGSSSNGAPFASIYTPSTGVFAAPANQPSVPREGHQAVLLANLTPPMVVILGGSANGSPVASAEWFNTQTNTFSPVGASMASPREDFGVAALPSGKLLLVGGSADGSSALATAEIFDPVAVSFTPTAGLASARISPSVIQLSSGAILVLGGSSGPAGVAPVESFTPAP